MSVVPTPEQRLAKLPRSILAMLLRVGRRIDEDKFEGEITICVARGGVRFVRWTQTETGDVIKEELG
jgi:hypothetical protein